MTLRSPEDLDVNSVFDPELWDLPELRSALARHDFKTVFEYLMRPGGVSQRQLAAHLCRAQSEVHDIAKKDRKVQKYDVLVEFAERLLIPRGYMVWRTTG